MRAHCRLSPEMEKSAREELIKKESDELQRREKKLKKLLKLAKKRGRL